MADGSALDKVDSGSPYAVLFSGGKDSNCAMVRASHMLGYPPSVLITIRPSDPDDLIYHHVNTEWTGLQAEAAGLPHIMETEPDRAIQEAIDDSSIRTLVTGGIASRFQKRKFEEIASRHGLKVFSPLWGLDQEAYMRSLIDDGILAMVVRASSLGLDRGWLGLKLDRDNIERLIRLSRRYGFNPSLEGGEGETFVLDSPLYHRAIVVDSAESRWLGDRGVYLIRQAHLTDKPNVR